MSEAAADRPGAGRAWWSLGILFLAYTLSFVDRTILSLLVEPIRRDLGLSDTEISLLQGLAFALFYTLAGIPIASLADRASRRTVIAVGIALWSVMTAACGLAGRFWQLFLARMGVGVGEAALGPAAFSLIADIFPEEKRGRALAIYSSGINFGAGAALLIGGAVIGFAARAGTIDLGFGALRSWQLVFVLVGLPGVIVALLALTIAEPARRLAPSGRQPSVLPFLRAQPRAVWSLFFGMACCGTIAASATAWMPTLFIRVHGYDAATVGRSMGLVLLIAGPLGAYAGGAIADRWTRAGLPDAAMRAALFGVACATVLGPAAALAPDPRLTLALLFGSTFAGAFCYPCGAAALTKLAPPPLRARMTALYLLAVALVSGIVGPTGVALATDYLFADRALIGRSLALVMALVGVASVVLLAWGRPAFRRAVTATP